MLFYFSHLGLIFPCTCSGNGVLNFVVYLPPADSSSVTGKWSGWGFVNFRATVHRGNEKVYGEFFNAGDVIGVRLDMDQGA